MSLLFAICSSFHIFKTLGYPSDDSRRILYLLGYEGQGWHAKYWRTPVLRYCVFFRYDCTWQAIDMHFAYRSYIFWILGCACAANDFAYVCPGK
jgi:hypothetical protein